MSRSIRVAPEFISLVKQALRRHRFPSQKALAVELGISRSTTDKFFTGEPVDFSYFLEISDKLGLDWQAIADKQDIEASPPSQENKDLVIDTLVQKVRQQCQDRIQYLCGKMQLLDTAQPVDIDNFYVDINILEEITSYQWQEPSDLLQDFNPDADNFDRLGLSKVHQQQVPGLEAVKMHPRLMVFGKPGSGKTTFLKHIAVQCNKGEFQANRLPIFIPLKTFAEDIRETGNFSILRYISQEFEICGLAEQSVIEKVLRYGRALILLDGLDEIPDEDSYEVVKQIRRFTRNYYKNQFIISCRIAALKYRFHNEAFTDVEVADFNDEQIQSFAENCFVVVAKNDQEEGKALAKQFIKKLKGRENQPIRELAATPILLNLLCLVFQGKADFPSNRAKLYEQALNIMLVIWDEARCIQRDEAYRNLSVPRKKQLLAQVAAITFEWGDYFFEQDKIQQLIADYLGTLHDAKTDLAQLQLDSKAVLKCIEVQHGLLVERARGIYSFSHLTFQEYFIAGKIVTDQGTKSLASLQSLVSHIADKPWHQVFLLAIRMCKSADCLLLLMKRQIDDLVAADEKLMSNQHNL